jgi:uncharacterized protein YhbP (UPF0306 family)
LAFKGLIKHKKSLFTSCVHQIWTQQNFVKAIDQNSAGYTYLKHKFPRISKAQIKEGVFVGPQLRQLIQGIKFDDQLSEAEKDARKSLRNVTAKLFGKS